MIRSMAVVWLALSSVPANSGEPQIAITAGITTVDVVVELIRDYEERISPRDMRELCQYRNCDYRPRALPAPSSSYPSRDGWQGYQTPRPQRGYDYQDFRSPYRYQYER